MVEVDEVLDVVDVVDVVLDDVVVVVDVVAVVVVDVEVEVDVGLVVVGVVAATVVAPPAAAPGGRVASRSRAHAAAASDSSSAARTRRRSIGSRPAIPRVWQPDGRGSWRLQSGDGHVDEMTMTKRARSVGAAIAASIVFAACADASGAPGAEPSATAVPTVPPTAASTSIADPETLVVWADGPRADVLRALAPGFTEATGVEVLVEYVPITAMRARVARDAPAGDGPDVFVGPHDWSGDLAAADLIVPIDIDAKRDDFLPIALDAFNLGGRVYAVPYAAEAVGLYRNTGLVAEAPATWSELLAACDRVAGVDCLVVPGGGAWSDAYHNFAFVSAFGGEVFAFDESTGFDPTTVGLDTPAAVRGVEFLERQVAAGTMPATDYDGAKQRFLDGDAAFWITGPWELGPLGAQDAVSFDVSPLPRIGDGPMRPLVGVSGFYVSAFSEDPSLAETFLLDVVATDEAMSRLFDAEPLTTAWRSLPLATDGFPMPAAFVASASDGVPMPNIPEMGAVWGPLGDNLQRVRNGEVGAAEAMTATATETRAILAD